MIHYLKIKDDIFVINNYYAYNLFPVKSKHDYNLVLKSLPKTIFFLRVSTKLLDSDKSVQWYYIMQDKPLEIEDLSSNTRKLLRRSLRKFSYGIYDIFSLIDDTYKIYVSGSNFFGNIPSSKNDFITQIEHEKKFDFLNIEYFGVYLDDKLVGYSKNYVNNLKVFYESSFVLEEFRSQYINYGLFFKMNQHYINNNSFNYTTNGSRNILHETNIQNFLLSKLIYEKKYFKLDVYYRPVLGLLIKFFFPFNKLLRLFNSQKLNSLMLQEKIRKSFINGKYI